jgi:menaquinol-cytochrome c reductase iron-sulfur subunit
MSQSSPNGPSPKPEPPPDAARREFLKSAACVALGGACLAIPAAAGAYVLVAPLWRKAGDGTWAQLTRLEGLPVGGPPRLFQVVVERSDAWTRHPRNAVGAVFLQRLDEKTVRAFQAACPHLGCAVEWRNEMGKFFCPCHNSSFKADGGIIAPSPAARGLDTLAVEIRGDGEVWVRFQDFKAGTKEKQPVG